MKSLPVIAPLDDALRRAYTLARCIDYGCRPEDAQAMHAGIESGERWVDLAIALGERLEIQARGAPEGRQHENLLAASACYRIGQAALEDSPTDRLVLYQRAVATFGQAFAGQRNVQTLQTMYGGHRHGGWLFPVPDERAQAGCVILWGGADGWCEAFHAWVQDFHDLGLAVCLTELPGQGLARLSEGAFLTSGYTGMVSALIDTLSDALGPRAGPFALLGNSLGGSLAMCAAAQDSRVRACVTNGGSIDPVAGMVAFPRAARRLGAMLGPDASPEDATALLNTLDLPAAVQSMQAALLCVHGGQDPLVSDSEVARLQALRPDMDVMRWADGVHCVYNHAAERNRRVAAWVRQALQQPS